MAYSGDVKTDHNTEASLSADTRITDPDFQYWPTTGANVGKYKQGDGIHTYAQLPFQDPTVAWGSGGGGPASALTQAEVDGIQASTDPLTGINAVVSAQELGNSLAANSSNRIRYQFDTATGDADPGAGKFRLNNGTIGSATLLYISETDREGNALSALLDTLGTAGTLVLRQFGGTDVASFTLGAITDASGYKKIGVTLVQGSLPANDDEFILDVWGVLPTRASLGVPDVWVADCLDFTNPGVNTTVLKTQLGTITIASNGTGDYTITSTAQFTTATTILLMFSTSDATVGLHFGADFVNSSTINVAVTDKVGDPIDPSGTTRIIINAYPS